MKLTFSIGKDLPEPRAITGRMIRSARVMPNHAGILRDIKAFNGRQMRMYEAAVTNNLNADSPVSITSSNSEILISITAARSRSRRLERDNPYARAILESFQDNIGGDDPFRLEMKVGKWNAEGEFTEEVETNRMIEEAWEEAGLPENCTVRRDTSRLELDLQTITAFTRDGGILGKHHRAFPNNKFAYAIEPIEIDRLDHYWNRPSMTEGNEIQFSIEFDEYHAPIAYWILNRHPGDVFAWSSQPKYRERIPAKDIIALFDIRTRAGQYVGMPRLSSIIQRLHRIDQFDIAHVTAAIWSACKPFFIVQDYPTAAEYVPDVVRRQWEGMGEGEESGEGDKISNVEPGSGEELPFGKKPMLVDPKFPIEAASGFKKDNLRAAAAGSGANYNIIGQDLEGVNFSSGRLGFRQFQDTCQKLSRHYILNYRRPHFNEWLKSAILSGVIDRPISRLEEFKRAANFYGRTWDYVNPLQDAQADILLHEAGMKPRDKIIRERGGKGTHDTNSQYASDKKCDDTFGLDFSNADVTKPDISKGAPGQTKPTPESGQEESAPPPKKGGKQTLKANLPKLHRNGNGKLIETAP